MVEGRGAAVLEQIGESCQRRVVDYVPVNPLENPVDLVQPLGNGHVGIIDRLEVSYKSLEEMVVGIDKAGIHELAGSIDGLVDRTGNTLGDFHDLLSIHQHVLAIQDGILCIAGDDGFRVLDEQLLSHGNTSSRLLLLHRRTYSYYNFNTFFKKLQKESMTTQHSRNAVISGVA